MRVPKRGEYAHWIPMPVRWGDADMLGHVNNARFFTYAESARIAYFEDLLGEDPRFWKEYGFILARIDCDFLAQLRYPATLDIGTRVTRIGRSSIDIEHGMFAGEAAVARSQAVVVWFDYRAQKPAPVPPSARAFIDRREGATQRQSE